MNRDELPEIRLDAANLFREETFTDRHAGILRRMTPVKSNGDADDSRPTLFLGQTQLMTEMGALPVSFEMEVNTLEEALEQFPEAAKKGIEETLQQLQEMRRESASSIITPGQGGGGMAGQPGGGLQMP